MNKREKDRYRKMLLEKKQEISHLLSEFNNDSKSVETGIAQDVGDKAESSYTKEFLLSLSDTERKQLFLIDGALKRIDTDHFGICQMCEKPIGKKRLDAVPWAPLCIVCQQKEEEESA
ncbi:MAG: TraR/DksA family transcriptional regulator [Candidatus Aminicenantes bacterium]|nr:TraR/DksA family transcriptional regulator [Candidatus Aminicenantes bacterium]